jgi:hypothetical protein
MGGWANWLFCRQPPGWRSKLQTRRCGRRFQEQVIRREKAAERPV